MLVDGRGRPLDAPLGTELRPSWRGGVHLAALILAAPLAVMAVVGADGGRARLGVAVYAVGLCTMLAVSTTYHRWVHTLRARAIWRRADHAAIFVAIAATATPLCLSALPRGAAGPALVAVWAMAAAGIVAKVIGGARTHRLSNVAYIGNSWAGCAIVPALWSAGHVASTVLVMTGGVIYTTGAIGFARQWPRVLVPAVFGYHEIWHAATAAAAAAHFTAIWLVTT